MSDRNVCKNQTTFNNAFTNALNYYNSSENTPSILTILYAIILLIFLIWAVFLVLAMKKSNERILHLFFAIIASPLYVISYYLNNI
jgi:hypothetical protein